MSTIEGNSSPSIPASSPAAVFERQQRRRMWAAFGVLLVALVLVLVKDRQMLFPPAPVTQPEAAPVTSPSPVATAPAVTTNPAPPVISQKVTTPPVVAHKKSTHPAPEPAVENTAPQTAELTATNRAVLPPLEVEVVAGNQHRTINPGDNSVNVELQSGAPNTVQNSAPATDAAAHVQLSPGAAQLVTRSVEPNYPLLAKQMKVQGAVVLQALIGKAGEIEDVQVLSGPAILSAAAREAVKQWRFKPYLQSGRAVETEARITVNFTISTY
jgi:periplasmic protein TonB